MQNSYRKHCSISMWRITAVIAMLLIKITSLRKQDLHIITSRQRVKTGISYLWLIFIQINLPVFLHQFSALFYEHMYSHFLDFGLQLWQKKSVIEMTRNTYPRKINSSNTGNTYIQLWSKQTGRYYFKTPSVMGTHTSAKTASFLLPPTPT